MGKKIDCLCVVGTPPPTGGASVMSQNTIDILKRNGLSVLHINTRFSRDTADRQMYNIHNNIYKVIELIRVYLKILYYLLIFDINRIYYALSSNKYAFIKDFILLFPSLILNKKIIIHLHLSNLPEFYRSSNSIIRRLFGFIRARNTVFIVLSDKLKEKFSDLIPLSKLVVVKNGIDFPKYNIKKTCGRDNLVCLFLGILIKSKGYFRVLECAKWVENRNIVFYIAGPPGPDYDEREVLDYIKKNGLGDKVRICGAKYGKEKEELYAMADVFVFPTSFSVEAMPLVLLEAMAYGLCIITSSKGAIGEIVQDQCNGFIIDSNNPYEIAKKIVYLFDHRDKLSEICDRNVKTFFQNYSIGMYERQMLKVFEFRNR